MISSSDITYTIKGITPDVLADHLIETNDEFAAKDDVFLRNYANKLSKNAKFVVAFNSDKNMIGMIAFYANQRPMAFISHVWVANSYRGGGFVA